MEVTEWEKGEGITPDIGTKPECSFQDVRKMEMYCYIEMS